MQHLRTDDLLLGLDDLFNARKDELDSTQAGQFYGPMLASKHTAIQALPEALRGGKPLAVQLQVTDARHDAFGNGVWSYTDAVINAPDIADEVREAARRIRAAFIPERAVLNASYAEEAATARKNRPKLGDLEKDLKLFPLPGSKTLYDWVKGFLDEGEKLDALMVQRSNAAVGTTSAKGAASKLRNDTVGLLYEFRAALRREIEHKQLAADKEAKIFSYLDELNGRHKKKPAEEEPTPEGDEGSAEGDASQAAGA
jgi:hypothetical protein